MTTPELLRHIDEAVAEHEINRASTEKAVISYLELAYQRNPALREQETINGNDFAAVGVPILTSCCRCGATLGAYNAFVRVDHVDDSPACAECVG